MNHNLSEEKVQCKANAEKNKGEGGWFNHEARPAEPTARPSRPNSELKNKSSVDWMKMEEAPPMATPRAAQQGEGQNWYKHGDAVPDPPSLSAKKLSRRSNCQGSQQKKDSKNSNEWFKHDHNTNPSFVPTPANPSSFWLQNEDKNNGQTPKGKARVVSTEADTYYKRDKIGSAPDWYNHLPSNQDNQDKKCKGDGAMSQKLKNESENWFSPPKNENLTSPQSGLASSANRRNQSSNISAIIGDYKQ